MLVVGGMSVKLVSKLVLFGVGVDLGRRVAARVLGPLTIQRHRRDPDEPATIPDNFAPDPQDPLQAFDEPIEALGEPLDVDALSNEDAESALDLARAGFDIEDRSFDSFPGSTMPPGEIVHDAGELYGVHIVPAEDTDVVDGDTAMDQGENWLEALSASSTEYGAKPERVIDLIDDEEHLAAPHPTDTRDIPVADRGSAGPRGL